MEEDKKGTMQKKVFSTLILKNYKEFVTDSIQRIKGDPPARVFIGMRVKTFNEIADEEEARMKSASAPAQMPEKSADENPFG